MNRNLSAALRRLIYFSLTLSFVSLGLSGLFFFERDQIVYVDSMKLLSQYKGTIQARITYDRKISDCKANVDTLTKELNRQIIEYQKNKKELSLREKKLTEELIGIKKRRLEDYKAVTSENAAREDRFITAQMFKEINDFLNKYGDEHGYNYILSTTNMNNVEYARKGKNITDEVLIALNGGSRLTRR